MPPGSGSGAEAWQCVTVTDTVAEEVRAVPPTAGLLGRQAGAEPSTATERRQRPWGRRGSLYSTRQSRRGTVRPGLWPRAHISRVTARVQVRNSNAVTEVLQRGQGGHTGKCGFSVLPVDLVLGPGRRVWARQGQLCAQGRAHPHFVVDQVKDGVVGDPVQGEGGQPLLQCHQELLDGWPAREQLCEENHTTCGRVSRVHRTAAEPRQTPSPTQHPETDSTCVPLKWDSLGTRAPESRSGGTEALRTGTWPCCPASPSTPTGRAVGLWSPACSLAQHPESRKDFPAPRVQNLTDKCLSEPGQGVSLICLLTRLPPDKAASRQGPGSQVHTPTLDILLLSP